MQGLERAHIFGASGVGRFRHITLKPSDLLI
jgi:hypothetical protein